MRRGVLTVLIMEAASCASTDWPQFRGPNATGISADADPPIEFGPSKGLLWKTPLPEGHSSPCVYGDRIFVTAVDRNEKKLETIAVARATGKVLWRRSVAPERLEQVHEVSNHAATTVVADGKRAYVYFGSYGLLAFEWDGKLAWEKKMPVSGAAFGAGGSPVIAADLIIVNRDYNPSPQLLAFSKTNGETMWSASLPILKEPGPETSHATPVVWKDQVLLHRPGELSAYSLKDGVRQWWVRLGSQGSSTPAVSGDHVYVNAFTIGEDSLEPVSLPPFSELLRKFDSNADGKLSRDEFPTDFNVMRRPRVHGLQRGCHHSAESRRHVTGTCEERLG